MEDLYKLVKKHRSDADVLEAMPGPYMRGFKACDRVRQVLAQKDNLTWWNITVTTLWGDAGSGKTKFVYDTVREAQKEDPTRSLYVMEDLEKGWFCGYQGDSDLLLDDYYGEIPYPKFLRLLDGYRRIIQVKGGTSNSQWKRVWITSNQEPKHWYPQGMTPALERRITEVREMKCEEREIPDRQPDVCEGMGYDSDLSDMAARFF